MISYETKARLYTEFYKRLMADSDFTELKYPPNKENYDFSCEIEGIHIEYSLKSNQDLFTVEATVKVQNEKSIQTYADKIVSRTTLVYTILDNETIQLSYSLPCPGYSDGSAYDAIDRAQKNFFTDIKKVANNIAKTQKYTEALPVMAHEVKPMSEKEKKALEKKQVKEEKRNKQKERGGFFRRKKHTEENEISNEPIKADAASDDLKSFMEEILSNSEEENIPEQNIETKIENTEEILPEITTDDDQFDLDDDFSSLITEFEDSISTEDEQGNEPLTDEQLGGSEVSMNTDKIDDTEKNVDKMNAESQNTDFPAFSDESIDKLCELMMERMNKNEKNEVAFKEKSSELSARESELLLKEADLKQREEALHNQLKELEVERLFIQSEKETITATRKQLAEKETVLNEKEKTITARQKEAEELMELAEEERRNNQVIAEQANKVIKMAEQLKVGLSLALPGEENVSDE